MGAKSIYNVFFGLTVVLIAYGVTNAQVVTAIKDTTVKAAKKTAEITKEVADETADTAKKASSKTYQTYKVVTEDLTPAANEAKDKTADAAKATTRTAAKIGDYSVNVTENVAGTAYEGGRWLTVTTWDGTKWVSKRAWFATKKAASAVKKF